MLTNIDIKCIQKIYEKTGIPKEEILEVYKQNKKDAKKTMDILCAKSGMIPGVVYGNVSTASTLYGMDKLQTPRGHGFAAERANHVTDLLKGRTARLVGDNNAKNGPDRIVDNIFIQSKYCKTGSKCIAECFENGRFRYMLPGGKPMNIEVPSDLYEDAVRAMEHRIAKGEVPGIKNPQQAREIVRKGQFTYEQAKNIAKFGNVDSLLYDVKNGTIIVTRTTSISAAITFAVSIWNGETWDNALKQAVCSGISVGSISYAVTIISSQLSRAGIEQLFMGSTEKLVGIMGPKASAVLANSFRSGTNIYGAAAMKSTAKLLRGNIVTGVASTVVLSTADVVNIFRGRISAKQLFKNVTTTAASVAGGTMGWTAGTAAGAAIGSVIPGFGTVAGGIVGTAVGVLGSLAGGAVSSKAANAVMDSFIEDDAEGMLRIIEHTFQKMAEDYLLNEKEAVNVVEVLRNSLTPKTLKDMFACKNQEAYAEALLREIVETEVGKRRKIPAIENKELVRSLRNLLECV